MTSEALKKLQSKKKKLQGRVTIGDGNGRPLPIEIQIEILKTLRSIERLMREGKRRQAGIEERSKKSLDTLDQMMQHKMQTDKDFLNMKDMALQMLGPNPQETFKELMKQGGQAMNEMQQDRERFKPVVIPKREYPQVEDEDESKEGIELAKEYRRNEQEKDVV